MLENVNYLIRPEKEEERARLKAEQEKLRNYHGKHEAEPEDAGTD